MAVKKAYLDRHEFHAELTKCKRAKTLSRAAIDMFKILCTEVSKKYYFKYEADRDDAIASAIYDCYKYWENFKESNVVQLKIMRNFVDNETIILDIANVGKFTYIAKSASVRKGEFQISDTPNKTITNLIAAVDKAIMGVYHDKVKCKITFMDHMNGFDLTIKSRLMVKPSPTNEPLISTKVKNQVEFSFDEPPNGFSYFTSVVDKGILKSINRINPKHLRNGMVVSLSQANTSSNGLFNL